MPAIAPTTVVLGREQHEYREYEGPADGAASALVEIGLRAAEQGDHAHALAQVFALAPGMREEYREMIAAIIRLGRKNGVRLYPWEA